jgi:hypothetical protein
MRFAGRPVRSELSGHTGYLFSCSQLSLSQSRVIERCTRRNERFVLHACLEAVGIVGRGLAPRPDLGVQARPLPV